MATAGPGQQRAHRSGVIHVIHDEQAPVMTFQPIPRRGQPVLDAGLDRQLRRVGQARVSHQSRQVSPGHRERLGADPPDHVVPVPLGVGVLHRKLSLADSADAGDRHHASGTRAGQAAADRRQRLGPACEPRIGGKRHGEHGRERAGEPRPIRSRRPAAGECGLDARPTGVLAHPPEQFRSRVLLTAVGQIHIDPGFSAAPLVDTHAPAPG